MSLTTFPPEIVSGTTTSWIPLTTPFTVPPSCSYAGTDSSTITSTIIFSNTQVYDAKIGGVRVKVEVTCQPEQALSWWNTASAKELLYSIGPLQCPVGYTTAKTSTITPGVIQVACCPVNYTFVAMLPAMIPGQCTSRITGGQVVTYVNVQVNGSLFALATKESTAGFAFLNTATSTAFTDRVVTALHINGRAFVDIPPSTPLPTPFPGSPTFDVAGTTTGLTTSTRPFLSTQPIISKQAIIGISFGVFFALFFCLTLGFWVYRRRSIHASQPLDDLPRALGYRNEMPGEDQRVEIDGRFQACELLEEKSCAHELCGVETAKEFPVDVIRLKNGEASRAERGVGGAAQIISLT